MKATPQIVVFDQEILNEKVGCQQQIRIRVEFFREVHLPSAVVAIDVQGAFAAHSTPPPVQKHRPFPGIVRRGGQPPDLQIPIARSDRILAGHLPLVRSQHPPVRIGIPILLVEVDQPADGTTGGTTPPRPSLHLLVVFVDVTRQHGARTESSEGYLVIVAPIRRIESRTVQRPRQIRPQRGYRRRQPFPPVDVPQRRRDERSVSLLAGDVRGKDRTVLRRVEARFVLGSRLRAVSRERVDDEVSVAVQIGGVGAQAGYFGGGDEIGYDGDAAAFDGVDGAVGEDGEGR
mmetsp:Transcript_15936/g.28705  ORF Transcript_15936/g.28705 Transcript_15936/m.28705 type:complete len:289 (-) Transcript_15936:93-959(-)